MSASGFSRPFLVVLCLVSLLTAGVLQAAHVHDAPISLAAGKHVLLAPADECPVCAAAHAALPAVTGGVLQLLPMVGSVVVTEAESADVERWHYELFSRPPPRANLSVDLRQGPTDLS